MLDSDLTGDGRRATEAGFASILPADVHLATTGERGQLAPLLGAERSAVSSAAPQRRREFALGRLCAREALRSLGLQASPIPPGPRREPIWPDGVVGSITHTGRFWGAVACFRHSYRAIGIDAEALRPLSPAARRRVACERELREVRQVPGEIPWETVIFSIKESVFKAWTPTQGRALWFSDALVFLDPVSSVFEAELTVESPGPFARVRGSFAIAGDLICSVALIPAKS